MQSHTHCHMRAQTGRKPPKPIRYRPIPIVYNKCASTLSPKPNPLSRDIRTDSLVLIATYYCMYICILGAMDKMGG